MKTLLNPKDKEQIIARLQAVAPTSSRLWGKMSALQMVCHFRMYMGLKPVSPARLPYPRSLVKRVALWAPIPWPKGFKTVPELDQQVGGTPPVMVAPSMMGFHQFGHARADAWDDPQCADSPKPCSPLRTRVRNRTRQLSNLHDRVLPLCASLFVATVAKGY
jgi:hypothetical protein